MRCSRAEVAVKAQPSVTANPDGRRIVETFQVVGNPNGTIRPARPGQRHYGLRADGGGAQPSSPTGPPSGPAEQFDVANV